MPMVVRVSRQVNFDCGCICEFPLVGNHSEQKEWHIVPCNPCAAKRVPGVLEQRAEEAWNSTVGYEREKTNLELAT